MGNFDPETGQPMPKFDPETGARLQEGSWEHCEEQATDGNKMLKEKIYK
jgi:hypothetical protein